MLVAVVFGSLFGVVLGMQVVTVSNVGMVRGLFVIAGFMMLGSGVVVLSGVFMVRRGVFMMLGRRGWRSRRYCRSCGSWCIGHGNPF
jgi:hypothetical protein